MGLGLGFELYPEFTAYSFPSRGRLFIYGDLDYRLGQSRR
jgi:hypothetical protein